MRHPEALNTLRAWAQQLQKHPYLITAKPSTNRRVSEIQYGYYWGYVLEVLCDHFDWRDTHGRIGVSQKNEMHEQLLQLFRTIVDVNKLTGEEYGRVMRTSEMDTIGMYEYVEEIRQWAELEHGLTISPPDPSWRNKIEQQIERRKQKDKSLQEEGG